MATLLWPSPLLSIPSHPNHYHSSHSIFHLRRIPPFSSIPSFYSLPFTFRFRECNGSFLSISQRLKLQTQRRQWPIKSKVQEGDNGMERYLEEDGSVSDMEDYLDRLSLEYDSIWDTKPAWCQPWTIGLTGVVAISASWIIFQSVIVTTILSCLIGAWWYIFLYLYPQAYTKMIAERRKKVRNGLEDTYGVKKVQ